MVNSLFLTSNKSDNEGIYVGVHRDIQPVGARGANIGLFGDEVKTSTLPGDTWRWRQDNLKVTLMSICNESMIRAHAEVFGLFRHLIPAELTKQGGDLHYGRRRVGLTPDLLLRLPTPDGVRDCIG